MRCYSPLCPNNLITYHAIIIIIIIIIIINVTTTINFCVHCCYDWVYFISCSDSPPQWDSDSSLSRLYDHTQTHHSRQDSYGLVFSPTQRTLPDNTQQSQDTDIHNTCGIRTHNPNKRAVADPRLRPRGHWDRLIGHKSWISYRSLGSRLITSIKKNFNQLHCLMIEINLLLSILSV